MIEARTRIPKNAGEIINRLVEKGYYSSMADFARQAILDKLLEDFEIGLEEPEIVKRSETRNKSKKLKKINERT